MNKKMEERIEEIDYIIMSAFCLEMLLIGVWEDFDAFLAKGVILGNA